MLQTLLETDATLSAEDRRNMLESLKRAPEAAARTPVSARLLNYRQAADMLGLSKQTVRRLVKDGRLPVVETRVGRLRVPEQAVIEMAAGARRKEVVGVSGP